MNIFDYVMVISIILVWMYMGLRFIRWLITRIIKIYIDEHLETTLEDLQIRIRKIEAARIPHTVSLMSIPLTLEEQASLEEQEKVEAGKDIEPNMPYDITNREELYERILTEISIGQHESCAAGHHTNCIVCKAKRALEGKNPWI